MPRGRPPKSAAVANRDRKIVPVRMVDKEGKTCISCHPENAFKSFSNFYVSVSPLHADGLVPMCKDCIVKYSYDFTANKVDMDGFLAVLRQIDRPFIKSVLDSAYKEFDEVYSLEKVRSKVRIENGFQVVVMYFKILLSSPTYRKFRWTDGETSLAPQEVEDTAVKPQIIKRTQITDEVKRRFGAGFTDDDYRTLQDEYDEWCDNLGGEPEAKSTREVIKNCCYAKLAIVHGVTEGGNISQLISSFNNSLSVGDLKPQEKLSRDKLTLGETIKAIEEYAPAEFFQDKLRHQDFDKRHEYISRFMLRPMRNAMLGERVEDKEFSVSNYVDSDE